MDRRYKYSDTKLMKFSANSNGQLIYNIHPGSNICTINAANLASGIFIEQILRNGLLENNLRFTKE